MQITDDQINDAALTSIGREVVQLLRLGEVDVLANRFGYAVAFDREPAAAIHEDLTNGLKQLASPGLAPGIVYECEVKFFGPNTSNLFALIECIVPALEGGEVLIELVITASGAEKHVTIEQISAAF